MTTEGVKNTVFLLTALAILSMPLASVAGGKTTVPNAYQELLNHSMENKSGLSFYVKGQVIPAIVTKIIDATTVEARNQQFGRIIIRLDRVDSLAMH